MARKVWVPAVSGPLAGHAAGYRSWLEAQSYSPSSVSDRLWQFAQLSRWLADEGLIVGGLTAPQCERFVASRRAAGQVTLVARQSMTVPLEYLHTMGATPQPTPVSVQGPVEELLADYVTFLLVERGLSPHTVFDAYVPAARMLLTGLTRLRGRGGLRLDRLSAADELVLGWRVSGPQRVRDAGSGVRAALLPALPAPVRADRCAAGVGVAGGRRSA